VIKRFITGIIGQPFGVKGFVKVRLPSGDSSHFDQLEKVTVRFGTQEKNLVIEDTGHAPSSFVIKFKGYDSPEAAKALQGGEILVDRDAAAPLEENEYYIEDLRGLTVHLHLVSGPVIGTVTDVVEGGGGQLMEIQISEQERRLVPFRNEFIGDIDIAGGTVVLKEGWILE
jgi:16S rRNA processing protein RimM